MKNATARINGSSTQVVSTGVGRRFRDRSANKPGYRHHAVNPPGAKLDYKSKHGRVTVR